MDYDSQVSKFTSYFETGEKTPDDFLIGMELEHFVVEEDSLTAVSYYGDNGVNAVLKELESKGMTGVYEADNILGLTHPNFMISLEPGSQLEFSARPRKKISELAEEYREFRDAIDPILKKRGYLLLNLGYWPVSKIEDIRRIPKKRYDLMYEYFKDKGKYAHNMMKGTAALQVAIDYSSEKDFSKKFYVANAISPILYAVFDNSPIFEGVKYDKNCLRAQIWENCDDERCGVVEGAMTKNFGYEDYAEYILHCHPIFIMKDGEVFPTGTKQAKEVFNPRGSGREEIEHLVSMVFPDVRLKTYLEIRVMDSVPIEYALGLCAMLKGLFYNQDNLNDLYDFFRNVSEFGLDSIKEDIIANGIETEYAQSTMADLFDRFLTDAKYALPEEERIFLEPLERLLDSEMTLKDTNLLY